MKTQTNYLLEKIVIEVGDRYIETNMPELTNIYDGTVTYKGYGTIDGLKVCAKYLFNLEYYERIQKENDNNSDWECDLNWDECVDYILL